MGNDGLDFLQTVSWFDAASKKNDPEPKELHDEKEIALGWHLFASKGMDTKKPYDYYGIRKNPF